MFVQGAILVGKLQELTIFLANVPQYGPSTYKRSVNFEISFNCQCFDQNPSNFF